VSGNIYSIKEASQLGMKHVGLEMDNAYLQPDRNKKIHTLSTLLPARISV